MGCGGVGSGECGGGERKVGKVKRCECSGRVRKVGEVRCGGGVWGVWRW